ncbi:hypothetical protein EZI54_03510 [Marinobacter halodurans]|uniref:Rhamnogalacturonan endolyase n=1 Tax=Marinobacter halodurans TaxID=2528979 RepID=A0ABY1ZP04_9GAMM|nr:rhamnogalacturonan lyase B N-terminal domain-containing protein [Marinobacter halodurans]TBW58462.1 hypothetical protein EZI54_03510 [Marinobacter halodurans]
MIERKFHGIQYPAWLARLSCRLIVGLALLFPGFASAGFGLDVSPDIYTVDTGAGLTFKVRRTNWGTLKAGDIVSINYQGVEYHNRTRGSQVNAGFDWLYSGVTSVDVEATTRGEDFIKITVQAGDLTHYYMARRGYPHIYMATYFTREPDIHNHVRYILRLNSDMVPNGPEPSDIRGNYPAIEASDIFGLPNGETRSKHYSNERLKDWSFIGARGGNVGMWIVRDRYEGGSGGPFYRSLLNQATDTQQQLTYIVNYGEAQTEKFRTGILNSYTFVVTNGSAPDTNLDTSWFSKMDLKGFVPPAERGLVAGVGLNGKDSRYEYTVGFASHKGQYGSQYGAQYWADASDGFFKVTDMLPGTYDVTVYKNELEVLRLEGENAVTVKAGGKTLLNTLDINKDPSFDAAIWRIGEWDGTPLEMLNGDVLTTMHPSDSRIPTWDPGNYIVGRDQASKFPAYLWKDINNDHVIYFKLSEAELAKAHTLRIGITCAFAKARPLVRLNGKWQSSFYEKPSKQPNTRTLTIGTYRGNNHTHQFDIPADAWRQDPGDWNKMTISVISGSGGSGYLSAGFSVDSIDLLR